MIVKLLFFVCALMLALHPVSGFADSDSVSFNPLPVAIKAVGGDVPVGTVIGYTGPENFENWLECNGQSTAGYPELAAIVGANVPNYQGMFLRGYGSQNHSQNNGSTVGVTVTTHSSGALGTVQGDAIRNIVGSFSADIGNTAHIRSSGAFVETGAVGTGDSGERSNETRLYQLQVSRVVPTAPEIRPVNMAVRYLIRAKP
jgi:hypothetical protein